MLPTIQPFVRWPCSPPHGHRGGSLAVHTPCTPCGRPAWSLLSLGAAAARPLRPLERAGAAGRRCRPVRPQNSGENTCEPPPPRPERPAPLLWPGQGTALRARRACTGAELWRRLRHALTAPILPTGRGVNGAVWGHALDEHSSSRGSSLFVGVWGHRGFLPPGRGGSRTVGCVVVLVHSDSNQKRDRTLRHGRHRRALPRPASGAGNGDTPPEGHVLMSSATYHRSAAACAQRARAQAAARVRARERESGSWRGRPGRAGAALPPRSRAHGAHGERTCAAS